LRVRFFRADVYRVWRVWSDRIDGRLPPNIKIVLDGDNLGAVPAIQKSNDLAPVGSVTSLSVDYTKLEDYLEKSMFILEDPEDLQCKCCNGPVSPDKEQILVCPQPDCRGTSHILCLSTKFLDAANDPDRLTPVEGTCPACATVVQWSVLMQELSFRNRAEKEARAIIAKKEKRLRKESKAKTSSEPQSSPVRPGSQRMRQATEEPAEDDLGQDWYKEVDLESDSDFEGRQKNKSARSAPKLDIVIEDSDWDDAELVE
jgi:structure-specific endonuclease subunit SLX1